MELIFTDIKKVMRGYDPIEVDKRARQFNDEFTNLQNSYNNLLSDYNVLKDKQNQHNLQVYEQEKKITDLEIENKRLHEEINKLKEKYMFSTSTSLDIDKDDSVEGLEFIQ